MEPLITIEMIIDAGIVVKDDKVDAYLEHLNEQLTERIGEAITETLDEAKLEELSTLQETATDEELGNWLSKNVSDLDEIIADEIDILMADAIEESRVQTEVEED